MNPPSPAIVTQEAARRLPRLALWLLCVAYVAPGFLGRAPWKSADIASFGFMQALAEGRSAWLAPTLFGLPPDVPGPLAYWLGAWALRLAPGWLAPELAVRVPFALMLALTLAATWHATYCLARHPGAQPVAFAFGGEAEPRDYARALADGSLLALIATLGLAQLSHETTPALTQLCFTALAFMGLAALPFRPRAALGAVAVALPGLALAGAPALALAYGSLALVALARPLPHLATPVRRRAWAVVALAVLASAALAGGLHLFRWQWAWPQGWAGWRSLGQLLLWFTWPIGPLALWTLWRWRGQLGHVRQQRHLGLPLMMAGVALAAALLSPGRDRARLAALAELAALAALALPTLRRSMAALIDWFTVLFFSAWAIVIWVVWLAMQTGVPAKPAANVARLAPGFEPVWQWPAFVAALLGTLAWAWLARWRTGRHRTALWKSLVLPAAGAALCWLLLMTLWLPALDYGRSLAPQVREVARLMRPMGQPGCVHTQGLGAPHLAALHFHGGWAVQPLPAPAGGHAPAAPRCPWLLTPAHGPAPAAPWVLAHTVPRPASREDTLRLYRRADD
ncbi:MAG: hypothetical protein Q4D74_03505 [Comamonadaceae bacterium]|nr:hypothetical protein [Comamonadaceae bacterium]